MLNKIWNQPDTIQIKPQLRIALLDKKYVVIEQIENMLCQYGTYSKFSNALKATTIIIKYS